CPSSRSVPGPSARASSSNASTRSPCWRIQRADVPTTIALSTASVYPESTAHAFAYAAKVGYDAMEVMVGIDALSQQVSAVKQLADHHELPIAAVHSPCLLFTQRVWG